MSRPEIGDLVPDLPGYKDIQEWVMGTIVAAFIGIALAAYDALDSAAAAFVDVVEIVLDVLDLAIGILADVPLDVMAIVVDVATNLAGYAGPLAPLVVALMIAAMLAVLRSVAGLIIRVIPIT